MAAIEHIYGRRERSHRYIFPFKVPAYEHREMDSTACGLDILAAKPGMFGEWFRKLRQDSHKVLKETSTGAKWVEDTNCEWTLAGPIKHSLSL